MSTKTILNVRTEVKIKKAAQRAAKEIGVSLSTVVNASLRAFIERPHLELVPNAKTRREIDDALKELEAGQVQVFNSVDEMFADMRK